MKKQTSAFTSNQTRGIHAGLLVHGFQSDAVAEFIGMAQEIVVTMNDEWPAIPPAELAEGRRQLKEFVKHIAKANYAYSSLTREWKIPLLFNLSELNCGKKLLHGEQRSVKEFSILDEQVKMIFSEMMGVANRQIDCGTDSNSRETARKRYLVAELAKAFMFCFDLRPTATPEGPFMDAVKSIGETCGMTIGTDAVRTAIKNLTEEEPWHFTDN